MTETLNDVTKKKPAAESAEQQAARELVRRAREQGLSLTGPDGLLKQLTKTVLETALNEEMTEHLGHEKHSPPTGETGNIRNGTRGKTVLTESTGQVEIEVPRDRAGTFDPQIVRKRQRRLTGVDEMNDRQQRPLDEVYAAIFIDAIMVKVRDGQVSNRPFYAAIGVSLDGEKDILGL
jgi:putative transposase